jgi:uncharacterized protein DUF4154
MSIMDSIPIVPSFVKSVAGHNSPLTSPRVLAVFLAISFFTSATPFLRAQTPSSPEYRIQAEYLSNFAKFVEWPDDAFAGGNGAFVIGVLGNFRFGVSLSEAVTGKTVRGRKIKIQIMKPRDNLRECHILFVGGSDKKHLTETLASLRGASVLTVGESDEFLEAGGTIRFRIVEERIRFEVNLSSAEMARLRMSPQLLAAARSIRNDPQPPKS